ncbi:MAG: DinB family protein [Planctomycetota bacterium]|nr:DinB family protein [Planctomycetota bacterium]
MSSDDGCQPTVPGAPGSMNPTAPPATEPLVALLAQLDALLAALSAEQYTRSPVGEIRSSIGSHVRHCLDHVEAWVRAAESGTLDYDHRERGTLLEKDRDVALETIRRLSGEIASLSPALLDRPVWMSAQLSAGGPSYRATTSVMRELMFVVSHTIHHNALIAVMLKLMNAPAPEQFGYAPATLTHLRRVQTGA